VRYEETEGLPAVQALLLLEGRNDHAAVARAVNAPVRAVPPATAAAEGAAAASALLQPPRVLLLQQRDVPQ
jgi:hypothetical protein